MSDEITPADIHPYDQPHVYAEQRICFQYSQVDECYRLVRSSEKYKNDKHPHVFLPTDEQCNLLERNNLPWRRPVYIVVLSKCTYCPVKMTEIGHKETEKCVLVDNKIQAHVRDNDKYDDVWVYGVSGIILKTIYYTPVYDKT